MDNADDYLGIISKLVSSTVQTKLIFLWINISSQKAIH